MKWFAPNPDSKDARDIRDKADRKGWRLPDWMNYRMAPSFRYEGVGVAKDQLQEGDPTIKRKKAIATEGGTDYREEVEEYKISPYLTSETPQPLPDTGKQTQMMKSTQAWSREGPLLPKEGLESPKELRNSVKGKNAKKKLEETFTKLEDMGQREYDHRILPVRVGKKNYKWALYMGVQRGDRTSRRIKVSGGRDLRMADVEAVEKVKCPTCEEPAGDKCVNRKTGKTLDYSKTHVSRIKKFITENKKGKWEYGRTGKGVYRGDTGR